MIPTATDVKIEGSLPGEDVQMTLDSNSLAHLMSVLSNLYSNKPLAVVREYATNALDSHIAAGVDRPIEISTPSDFMPFLKIRDYGLGMDAETIRNVYSKYGASTKRETNLQNGMLGLGSKSALTYTTQFNITGIKDGIKTYVVVSRAADGTGTMKIISQSKTDEPNGVEISIPVSNRREIDNVVHNFFKFWKPGTVLINGKEPVAIQGIKVGKFIVISEQQDYIVMGNVAYPVPEDHRIFKSDYYSRTGVVVYVEMGDVNFTPSREALHMTQLTKATLSKLSKEFAHEVKKYLEEKVSNAPSHAEALKQHQELQRSNLRLYVSNLTYKGQHFPTTFSLPWVTMIDSGHTYSAKRTDAYSLLSSENIIVHGYEHEKVHTTHRKKIRLWLESQGKDAVFVYWCKDVPGAPWTDEVPKVCWEDVKKIKIVRPKTTPVKQVLFDEIDSRGYRIPNNPVDTSKQVVFASPAEVASKEMINSVASLLLFDNSIQFVLVNKNKWSQFKKDFPQARHLDDQVKLTLSDYLNNLTAEEKIYLRSNWKDRSLCARLDESKVLDPKIKAAIRTLGSSGLSGKTTKRYEAATRIAHKWRVEFPDLSSDGERLFEGYPLLDVYSYSGADHYPLSHVYLYMNTCYKENLVNP